MWVKWNSIYLRQALVLYFQNWMNEKVIFSISGSVKKKNTKIQSNSFFQGPHMSVHNNVATPFLKRYFYLGKMSQTKGKVWFFF